MTTTPPTNPTPEPIEQQLAQATQWTGGDTALWQRALEQVEREATPARPSILATINRHARMAAMIVIATMAVVIAAVTTRHASRFHDGSPIATGAAPAASAEHRGDFLDRSARQAGGFDRADTDVILGRKVDFADNDGAETLHYQFSPSSEPEAPPAMMLSDAPTGDAQFDQFDATNDRFAAVAKAMRPGSDNPLSQSFSGQHANLPVPPQLDAADASRERTVAGESAPLADDKLAISKAAEPVTRKLDGETYALQSTHEESAAKREQPIDPEPAAPASASRAIVRTVNMNLGVEDVRAAFSAVESTVNTSPASYIESSELRGEGRTASASIVIRVPAVNLDPLIAVIRPLGKILVETSTAQDVGEQLVDLNARLSNAQRFEGELLETLNRTNNAKPNEILEVQRAVSDVRENIERLSAQRTHLSRQIALSTIRITLTADPQDITPARAEGISGYLGRQLHNAWRGGLVAIANSFAWLVSIIVGGALWWALLIITILLTRRWLKKKPT